MFDLAKALGVEEDEEFMFRGNDTYYRVHNNSLECWFRDSWELSKLTINEILKYKINEIWMPKVDERYYTVDFYAYPLGSNVINFKFNDDDTDYKLLQDGLVFKTEEEAKDMATYLLKKVKEYRKID